MAALKTLAAASKPTSGELALLCRQLRPLFREHGVKRASIFGSFARGEQTATSDMDILVEFQRGKSLIDLIGLKQAIEETTERKADITTNAALHPRLRPQILSEAIPIFEAKGR